MRRPRKPTNAAASFEAFWQQQRVIADIQRVMARLDRKRPTIQHWKRCISGDYETLLKICERLHAQGCHFHYQGPGFATRRAFLWVGKVPKDARPLCGAKTRKGTPCQAKATEQGVRCRLHGGLSTGPKTEAGREAIRESNRRRGALQA